jgi:hypothetical protein
MAANMITRMKCSLVSRYLCGLSALFVGLTTLDAQADMRVSNEDPQHHSMDIEISGVISEQDASSFAALSERLARKHFTVYLDSKGGDVFAAMKIGRNYSRIRGKYLEPCDLLQQLRIDLHRRSHTVEFLCGNWAASSISSVITTVP